MAFHHVPTFLRSAIARDPFCHGGIITPEDVLRLEAKFPTLFDKPALPETNETEMNDGKPSNDHGDTAENEHAEVKKKVTPKRNPGQTKAVHVDNNNKRFITKDNKVPQSQEKKRVQTVTHVNTGQRKISEYHKKCVEKVPGVPTWQSKKISTTSATTAAPKTVTVAKTKGYLGRISSNSRLTRPAQSFSLEDLRATLRQVMEEDVNQPSKWLRSDNSPSPYTEDLVQKFLGWKIVQDQKRRTALNNRNVHTLGKLTGQGDNASKLNTNTTAAYHENQSLSQDKRKNKLSVHTGMMADRLHPEKVIPRVRSAPGFIRGFPDLPRVPHYHRKRIMQSMAAKTGDGNKQIGQTRGVEAVTDIGNMGGGDGESGRKHVRWETDDDDDEDDEKCNHENTKVVQLGQCAERQSSQESTQSNARKGNAVNQKPKRSGMQGTQIHLRSQKTLASEQEAAEAVFAHDGRYKVKSSYNDLLTARSEKTRYEVKGYLRKQEVSCNFYKKQLEREQAERKALKTGHNAHLIKSESSSDPSENFTKKIMQMGQRSKQETNKILEVMAKELVYLEVLQQINELKREQEDTQLKELQKPQHLASPVLSSPPHQQQDKLSQGSLPNFVPTTTDQEGSESRQEKRKGNSSSLSSEIILKTPELTPPSALLGAGMKRKVADKKRISPRGGHSGKVDIISLHTPELSPSPKRLIAAIKERKDLEKKLLASPPQQQQLDTDCSEMSDFVFSEPSKKGERSQNEKMLPVEEEKSVKLDTPELSVSQPPTGNGSEVNEQLSNDDQNEAPEKDGSTLSGVPSTFLEAPSESQKTDNKPVISVHSVHEKYSDDFTSENISEHGVSGSLLAVNPINYSNRVKKNPDPNDNLMNTSGETVIDMLSDGEFLGTSYRSPGELSWRQQHAQPRPPATFLSNALADLSLNEQLNKDAVAHTSSIVRRLSFASSTMDESNDVEESISILSYGAQIPSGNGEKQEHVSVGEYLNT